MEKMSRVAFSLKIEGKEQRDEVWVFEGFGKAKKGLIFPFVMKMMMNSETRDFFSFNSFFLKKSKRKEEFKLRIFYVMCI